MEYSERIDDTIRELLGSRSRVMPGHLPGIPDEDGARFLEHYAQLHGNDGSVVWDGTRLMAMPSTAPAEDAEPAHEAASQGRPGPSAPPRSPVDEILAAPVGKSALDSQPAGGAVPGWLWILPLVFLLPGGIIAWWVARETNKTVARLMLVTGIVMTLVTILSLRASMGLVGTARRFIVPGVPE